MPGLRDSAAEAMRAAAAPTLNGQSAVSTMRWMHWPPE
ncbi:hypothetical protein [Cupriavidus necator]